MHPGLPDIRGVGLSGRTTTLILIAYIVGIAVGVYVLHEPRVSNEIIEKSSTSDTSSVH
jgi:hypothetical protein